MSNEMKITNVTNLRESLTAEEIGKTVIVEGNGDGPTFEVTKLESASGIYYEIRREGQANAEEANSLEELIADYADQMGLTED